MKSYSFSTGYKVFGHIISVILILVGSLLFYAAYDKPHYIPLIISATFFCLAFFITNRNYTVIVFDSYKLIIKRPFTANTEHSLTSLKAMALMTLPNRRHDFIGGNATRLGQGMGNVALSIAESTAKNSTKDVQFIAKDHNNKVITFKTNFINNSNQLIADIKSKTGMNFEHISSSEYKAWKNRDFYLSRKDPDLMKRQRIKFLSSYINTKILIILPIIIVLLTLITTNIWFNWAQYKYFETAEKPYSKDGITLKENPVELSFGDTDANIYLKGEMQPILKKINIKSGFCSQKRDSNKEAYKYYFFPYQYPYCFNNLLNLDDDNDPEIIYRHKVGKYKHQFRVYDFDSANHRFVSKSISSYSKTLEQYINIVTLNQGISWKYRFNMALIFLLGFLVFSLLALWLFNRFKKSVKPSKFI